jgi:thiamine phosphate synthase YjbQ (UPF0047 family)
MKSYRKELHFNTNTRRAYVNITPQVEAALAVTEGKPDFGTWEQIFYGEFDGKRDKRVLVKIIGE